RRLPYLAVMDLLVIFSAILLDPDLWFPMTIAALAATSIGWLLSVRVALLLAVISTAGVGITGLVTGADAAFATTALYGVVTFTLGLTNGSLYEQRTKAARRITELLDSVPVLLWEADIADARLTYVAGHVERILGVDAETWSTMSPDDWLHPDDLDAFDVDWDAHVDGEPLEHEVRARRGDGTWVPLRQIVRPVRVGGRLLLRGVSQDITAEQRAREAVHQYAEIVQRMHDGLIVLRHQVVDGRDTLRLLRWNRSAQELLRLTDAHRDLRFRDVLPGIARDVHRQIDGRPLARDGGPDGLTGTEIPVTLGADARWVDYELFRVSETAVALRISDVTSRKETQDLLRRQATHDHLTGLLNRVALVEHLEAALAAERHVGLLLLDLDQFKEINDTLGHHYGDRVLSILARRFSRLEGVDLVARLGGDEFAFLVDEVRDLTALEHLAERVATVVEQTIGIDDLSMRVGPSIGLALAPEHGHMADVLLQHADIAMYQAKRLGRGHMAYRPADDRHTLDRLALMAELPNLLAADELRMWFQPKVDLRTGRVAGVEALMRWEHPREGLLVPDRFIELLEVSGQLTEVTWVALDRSLSTVARVDPGLSIAVNIPARALHDPDAATRILDRLALAGLPPERLHLELTEREIMEDSTSVRAVLDDLRGAGVRISIDDFGTGYSSLSYLRRLPVSEIKIDRAFVAGMLQNDHDFLIARAITDLGHNLGHRIVAEGVEDEATLELLRSMGCDEAQGFLFARPVPPEQLAEVIRRIEDRWGTSVTRPRRTVGRP
ncbi:MAG: EAL domain-containing protein, partial [Acidimicrobiales bacterium]|nr:EAL domain-containing protein [Acidimicrobiales bacterium]